MIDRWPYLSTEAFLARYAMAAWLVRDCDEVIEIGGHHHPISEFFSDKKVTVIGYETYPCNTDLITHELVKFQDWCWEHRQFGNYGLVILGLHLYDMEDRHWDRLMDLVDNSQRAVIEVCTDWEPSVAQFEKLRVRTRKRVSFQWDVTIHAEDEVSYKHRIIYLLT